MGIDDFTFDEKQNALDEAWGIMNEETNAERIENMSPLGVDKDGNLLVKREDWFWLSEQAERAQELEDLIKSHAPEGRNYTNEQYVGLIRDFTRLQKALDFYADFDKYSKELIVGLKGPVWNDSEIQQDLGDIAREALGASE